MSRPIIVLGMHRSGTSMVTRVINLLGLPLGPEDDLYVGRHNPSGYWESLTLVNVNIRVLEAFLGTWKYPPDLESGWHLARRAQRLVPEMRRTFRRIHPSEPWVWKDPRTCITLPLWRQVLHDCEPAVVFVSRAPGSVARSLIKRGGVSRELAVAQWERYNRAALLAAGGMPFAHVRYEDLVTSPARTVAVLHDGLRTLGVPVYDDPTPALESIAVRSEAPVPAPLSAEQESLLRQVDRLPHVSAAFEPPSLPQETPSSARLLKLPFRKGLRIRLGGLRRASRLRARIGSMPSTARRGGPGKPSP